MIISFRHFIFLALSTACSSDQQLLNFVRTERAAVYQSQSVPPQSFLFINDSMPMPKEVVRPFERSLRNGATMIDVAVALWIPGNGIPAIWGRAWEENGGVQALFIFGNTVKILNRGFRLLIYKGSPSSNGFKFTWVRVKDADHGTILFSGTNMHTPAVFSEDGQYEFLGDADWQRRRMEFVKYGSDEPHTVGNFGGKLERLTELVLEIVESYCCILPSLNRSVAMEAMYN
ncbi:Retinal rod rhodopsin-sensitive cGMP 3',5'-cyclic phosphodiesterase subunit delta [Dirofilaria immitis]